MRCWWSTAGVQASKRRVRGCSTGARPPLPRTVVVPAEFWALLALNSVLACAANLTNFLVTKHTSALTLQVGKLIRVRVCVQRGRTGVGARCSVGG